MIPLLARTTVTRRRAGVAVVVDGYRSHPRTDEEIVATVGTVSMEQRTAMPSGDWSQRLIEVVSYAEIRSARDGAPSDLLVVDGDTYEVITADHLPAFLGQPQHWEAIAAYVEPTTVGAT